MHFRGTGCLGVNPQKSIYQAKRACDRDRKISQHCKANYGILAEKGIYPQSRWKEIWIDDGIDYEAGQITVIELLEKYISLKKGVRYNTQVGYKCVPTHLLHELCKRRHGH